MEELRPIQSPQSLAVRVILAPLQALVLVALPLSLVLGFDGGPMLLDMTLTQFLGWLCLLACVVLVTAAICQRHYGFTSQGAWSLRFAGLNLLTAVLTLVIIK